MDIMKVMESRHSVRSFTTQAIEGEVETALRELIAQYNAEAGLSMQLCLKQSEAFNTILTKYGKFSNVNNYIALVAKKEKGYDEKLGYYGEKLVLKAQELGLRTCWIGGTYSKRKTVCEIGQNEKLYIIIAIGYGADDGITHKTKPIEKLCQVNGEIPEWFPRGMQAAMLAPTAMNQQKFLFTLNGNSVTAKAGIGVLTKLDLGIVKCHFEYGAGDADWQWA